MRYEKGRKDVSRQRITTVAADRFRADGIAASGLTAIMSDAGLTNGAFYPHFESKAALVRESLAAAMVDQSAQLRDALAAGGLEAVIGAYLSAAHRDEPASGCASAALLPEVARQPIETRAVYTERLMILVDQLSETLADEIENPQALVLGLYAVLIGALQMARAVSSQALSDRILSAGADAAKTLIEARRKRAT
jgi:AcrR family transcriptional regulator